MIILYIYSVFQGFVIVVKRSIRNGTKYFDVGSIRGLEIQFTDMGDTSHLQVRLLVCYISDDFNYLSSRDVKLCLL